MFSRGKTQGHLTATFHTIKSPEYESTAELLQSTVPRSGVTCSPVSIDESRQTVVLAQEVATKMESCQRVSRSAQTARRRTPPEIPSRVVTERSLPLSWTKAITLCPYFHLALAVRTSTLFQKWFIDTTHTIAVVN
ncbi:hypothetical protein J6590_023827 [Homalodisca vitripennis]|nr:hypothetical protein J6590_023827 [Homalodisca vitripennis]